ncbi:pyrroline-5-carboxylate reductase [Arboricoccus pini]|uniref:Pyrroline-5-carboxylate reductase n=1 Tax=Arboricoccus pini TaxID=1963835 RepID=A0A212S272_9PROT|nr:pyrroline-5-carboxylate reductase [Arboricoccus pini]SNB79070.1 pyrroline-5-carboxylate reductase [Arboricoccus pini]
MANEDLVKLLPGKLVLVGGGKMGSALAEGWLAGGLGSERLVVIEPDARRRATLVTGGLRGRILATIDELADKTAIDAVVLAVKPQVITEVAPLCRQLLAPGTLVVSVAAGTGIARLTALLGPEAAIVRVMPNTPAAIGQGAAVLCAGEGVGATARRLATALMRASSACHWIEDETLMHAVTALSGSGPAYVFLLIEAMAAAGRRLGLPETLADALAVQTVAGAGELARRGDDPPDALRRNVTSPNGTTQAALEILMAKGGVLDLLETAMAAAARRSQELAMG